MHKISVAITAYNSSRHIVRAIKSIDSPYVNDIVVVDDGSQDCHILERNLNVKSTLNDDITLCKNNVNVGPLKNKWKAVGLCHNEWVILLDADDQLDSNYINILTFIKELDKDVLYCPVYGHRSSIDYRQFADFEIDRKNVNKYLYIKSFLKMMNTGIFFVYRKNYIRVLKDFIDEDIPTLDVMFFKLRWLENNYKMRMIKDLGYIHSIGANTNWKRNVSVGRKIKASLLRGFRSL